MSMAVLTSPSPSQIPFHPQTAAKPPRFVLGRRFSAETRLINPGEPYQPVKCARAAPKAATPDHLPIRMLVVTGEAFKISRIMAAKTLIKGYEKCREQRMRRCSSG